MSGIDEDWRTIGESRVAWFAAQGLAASAVFAVEALAVEPLSRLEIRPSGVRIRVDDEDASARISALARARGLSADPSELQDVSVVIESPDPAVITAFWQGVLGFGDAGEYRLVDPLERNLELVVVAASDARPLRNRVHVDVSRPAPLVEAAGLDAGSGPYGLLHVDPDGNEVDVVPGDEVGGPDAPSVWWGVFSGVAAFRAPPAQLAELVTAAAVEADARGFPLSIDVRSGLVIFDTGKDAWEDSTLAGGAEFAPLADAIAAAADRVGAVADSTVPAFVQLVVDADDIATVRELWRVTLGYVNDPRDGVTDIYDPRRLGPVLVFQDIDADDTARRAQRGRMRLGLSVPGDQWERRVTRAVAAGGIVLERGARSARIADAEGNEVTFETGESHG